MIVPITELEILKEIEQTKKFFREIVYKLNKGNKIK